MAEVEKLNFKGTAFIGNMLLIGMTMAFGFYLVFGEFVLKQMASLQVNAYVVFFKIFFFFF
jgi:hypothetical protein